MKKSYFLFFFCISILLSCTESNEKINDPEPINNSSSINSINAKLLFFHKENILEIWTDSSPYKRIQRFAPSFQLDTLAIGHYKKQDLINYSFLEKIPFKHQFQELLVFPNDSRITGSLEPCFACPHQQAALYAQLELTLKDFRKE